MITKENNLEKICALYASDFHFEMMILPYISNKIKNKENVFIITDKDLTDTVKIVISKINLKEDIKKEILKLNWKSDDIEKIKEKINKNDKINIIIKGNENYIDEINKQIDKLFEGSNVKIVNCYNIEEISNNMEKVVGKYENILNTLGEQKI